MDLIAPLPVAVTVVIEDVVWIVVHVLLAVMLDGRMLVTIAKLVRMFHKILD